MSLGLSILIFVVLDNITTPLPFCDVDVQVAFCFPFDKLAQNLYDVVA
jgi:hypothetical protein